MKKLKRTKTLREKFEKIQEENDTMSVDITSPRSESGSLSSRSDWFRKSVLFWSSQSDRSDNDSRMSSRRFTPVMDNNKHEEEEYSLTEESESEVEEEEMENSIKPKRSILDDFDPSDLLRQVEELEKCFTKSRSDLDNVVADDVHSGTGSPHLTLEFPNGSSIRENPLFKNDLLLRKTSRQEDNEYTPVPSPNTHPDNDEEEAKTPVDDKHIIESIQKVNDTLFEISREIELSSSRLSGDERDPDGDGECEAERAENEKLKTDALSGTIIQGGDSVENTGKCFMNSEIDTGVTDGDCSSDRTDVIVDDDFNSESDDRADPNDVMRDWLSNIKPPPSPTAAAAVVIDKDRTEEAPPNLPRKTKSRERNGRVIVPDESPLDYSVADIPRILSPEKLSRSTSINSHDDLFEKIDQLIRFERRDSENTLCLSSGQSSSSGGKVVSANRDRLDSGLQSVSSDSGSSPYPSPNITRAAPMGRHHHSHASSKNTIREESNIINNSSRHNDNHDHVFRDNNDSDFSEWSPVSTLASNQSTSITLQPHRPRSQSVTISPRDARQIHSSNSTGHMSSNNNNYRTIPSQQVAQEHVSQEMAAIEKFLKLTNTYLNNKDSGEGSSASSSAISLENLAMIPNLKKTLEKQKCELDEQRKKQEDFLHQLGDLLLEVVTLKEEHSAVRMKQTKALNLLKKQLDAHKKNQSNAHNDVIDRVNSLDEKLNFSLSYTGAATTKHSQMSPTSHSNSFLYPSPRLNENSSLPAATGVTSHNGHLIWKVSDVMKKLTRVKSGFSEGTVVSPPFQTGEYGYRMNGWLYLNGRGKMLGKYLSLYVCILVGDYDAILKWPIKPSYTLTLMDQNGDTKMRYDHIRVRRVIDIAGRGANVISQYGGIPRPNDCTKALIVGFDDFISHDRLLDRSYLVDDTLFIKIDANIS